MNNGTKIAAQFIFKDKWDKYQILYECYGKDAPVYYCTNNGAFNQGDTRIIPICMDDALAITKELTLV